MLSQFQESSVVVLFSNIFFSVCREVCLWLVQLYWAAKIFFSIIRFLSYGPTYDTTAAIFNRVGDVGPCDCQSLCTFFVFYTKRKKALFVMSTHRLPLSSPYIKCLKCMLIQCSFSIVEKEISYIGTLLSLFKLLIIYVLAQIINNQCQTNACSMSLMYVYLIDLIQFSCCTNMNVTLYVIISYSMQMKVLTRSKPLD